MRRAYLLLLTCMLLVLFVRSSEAGESIKFDGLIEPYMVVKVGSGVPGILETVNVDRGDFVEKGQVLAELQSGVEKATMGLARARAEMETPIELKRVHLEFEGRKYQRLQELYKKKAIPFHELDEAETNRMLAESELQEAIETKRLAELQLEHAIEVLKLRSIRSPITGFVVERYLSPGEYVEDQPILKLAQLNPLNVEVIAPVEFLGSIRVGTRAKVRPEAPVGGEYVALVTIVDRVVDAASGTFGVRLELPNQKYRLPAGLKCTVLFPGH